MENRSLESSSLDGRGLDVIDIIFRRIYLRSIKNAVAWADAKDGWYRTKSGNSTVWISCNQFRIETVAHGTTYQETRDFDTASDMYGLFQIVATTLFGENPQATLLHDFPE